MLKLAFDKKHSLAPLGVVLISVLLMLVEPTSNDWFAYSREQLAEYQWWRLITGHFLHTNGMHLVLNITGVVLLWALHGHYFSNVRYLKLLFLPSFLFVFLLSIQKKFRN